MDAPIRDARTPCFWRISAGLCVGMAWSPVFRREGHAPERLIGHQKLDPDPSLLAGNLVNVSHDALQSRLCLDVREGEPLPPVDRRGNDKQGTMDADRQRVRIFFKESGSTRLAGDSHR